MATHATNQQDEKRRECFLCILDPKHPCHEAQLEGRIIVAQERMVGGEKTAMLLLDTGTTRVEVHLEGHYSQHFMKELKARGDVLARHHLTLRVYHLPTAPQTIEYKGKTRLCYKGNSYTLAVLEPNILLNITDLNQAEYCARQYLLNRLIPSRTSAATIRGNLVHHCFKELLKEHDRGKFGPDEPETPLAALHRHLDAALQLNSVEMALADVAPEAMRADVAPHLESLARWYERERNTLWDMPGTAADVLEDDGEHLSGNQVRAETFLLAPEIGLRGRLDLFWQQSGRQRLLELKTGGASGDLPRREHRWQVYGYHALLNVRRDSQMKKALATLLYSGTPGSAKAFGIPASIRDLQRVNEVRNILVLSRATGIPPIPPGPSRCTKCSLLQQCQHISSLLQWQAPEPAPPVPPRQPAYDDVDTADPDLYAFQGDQNNAIASLQSSLSSLWTHTPDSTTHTLAADSISTLPTVDVIGTVPKPFVLTHKRDSVAESEFFAKYYHLLHLEGRAGEQQQALLWTLSVDERIERGTAISNLQMVGRPMIAKDGWEISFQCVNGSELREGDEILLSDGDPIAGEVVSGTILSIRSEQVTVWTRELIAHPFLIDRYDNDLVHVRTLQNLLRWQQASPHQQDLVAGRVRPRFIDGAVPPRGDFNTEQNLAVTRAVQMQDYLLIHGPPGTGKTSVIAEIVTRLVQQGQRVMLAAFTNQAVDNMLKRLSREDFQDYVRLGHERSVDETIRPRLLKELIETSLHALTQTESEAEQGRSYSDIVQTILHKTPVVASTTATWSSDKYTAAAQQVETEQLAQTGLYFDVAIIDEAGQLTVPAILGALRFAKRFILVGDEKQLPPLVLSKEAAEQGLSDSLFSFLKRFDDDYSQRQPLSVSACVALRVQYRMNKWIANFSSTVFYEKQLLAHASVADRRLVYKIKKTVTKQGIEGEDEAIATALEPRFPLVFLNVAEEIATESKLSNAEARAVRTIVARLLARGIEAQEIGIIAPYRAQVANIRRHLFSPDPLQNWPGLDPETPLSVDTVDRFQGGEKAVILISFATTQEPAEGSQRREFLVNPNRLNVALTRAQRKLILVGSVPALEPLPIFSRLITYCRSMNTLITPQTNAALLSCSLQQDRK